MVVRGHAVDVAVLGEGAVGGLEGCGGALHKGAQREVVEDFAAVSEMVSMEYVVWMWVKEKLPPHVCAAIFSQTLVVEAVYCGDLP